MRRLLETLRYIALFVGILAGRAIIRLVPRSWLLALFRTIADLGFHLFRGFRERSLGNLTLALGDKLGPGEAPALVRASLRNFFRGFIELGLAVESSLEQMRREIPARGVEHLKTALDKGNGVIVLSAHLGNFLLLGSRLAAEGYPVHVLINHPRTGKSGALADRYRLKIGQRTIHSHPRDEAFRDLVGVLRQNEIAVVIADELRANSGVYVPFFGRTVVARRGPATLALRTGAALVPACLERGPAGDLRLVIEPEIELARAGKIKANVSENTARITAWLERTVRAHPGQWSWMNVRWREQPAPAEKGREYRETAHRSA